MKISLITLLVSVLCLSCSLTKDWKGSSLSRKSNASFTHFSGKQKLNMKLNRVDGFTSLNYKVQLEAGEIQIMVKHKKKEIINVGTSTTIKDSILITNSDDLNVEVFLIGKNARGAYQIELKNP